MYTKNGKNHKIGSRFIQVNFQFFPLLLLVVVVVVVVVVQFRQAYLKNQTRYSGKTLHDDWNP